MTDTIKKRAAVIGCPVAHSLSPLMHTMWLSRYGLEGRYEKKEVLPSDLLAFLKASFQDKTWQGFNITLPHKEEAVKACHSLTPCAERMGAVNTLSRREGGWLGDNTDGWGCLRSLEEAGVDFKGENVRVVVVGAGGAARGITDALLEEGKASVGIINRSYEKAYLLSESLKKAWKDRRVDAYGFEMWRDVIAEADLVIHATPMGMMGGGMMGGGMMGGGMMGGPPFSFDFEGAKDTCVVMDSVYRPLKTPCLERAKERGLRTVDGLGMLMCQGMPGFRKWFGVMPSVDEALRRSLLEAMKQEGEGHD